MANRARSSASQPGTAIAVARGPVAVEGEATMRVELIGIYVIVSMCAACSGGDGGEDGEGGGDGNGSAEIDACRLLTQEDASALFDQPATRDEGAETVDPALLGECLWTWEAPDASNELLAIYVWDDSSGLYYSEEEGAEPLAIGDEGYIKVDEFAGVDIGWKQGDRAIYLDFFTIGPRVPAATTKVDEVKALAEKVEAAL